MPRSVVDLVALASLALFAGCAPSLGGPAVGVSGDVENPLQATVSVRLVGPPPRPGQPVDAEVVVAAFGPATDLRLTVTRQRDGGRAPDTVGTRTVGTVTAGDSVVVRYPVTYDAGRTDLRAEIVGYDARWGDSELGKAATLYALVYEGEAYVSGVSAHHVRLDSVRAHQGVLGRWLGWGESGLATEILTCSEAGSADEPESTSHLVCE